MNETKRKAAVARVIARGSNPDAIAEAEGDFGPDGIFASTDTCTCGRLARGWPGHEPGCPLRTDAQDAYDLACAALELAITARRGAQADLHDASAAYNQACAKEEAAAAELVRHEAHPGVPAFSHDHAKCTQVVR